MRSSAPSSTGVLHASSAAHYLMRDCTDISEGYAHIPPPCLVYHDEKGYCVVLLVPTALSSDDYLWSL